MAKYFGKIGFGLTVETSPGVWEERITEREYYGDVSRFSKRLEAQNQVNDNLNVNNEISIVSDPFAYEHFASIRYIEWMGVKWKVSSVEVQYPRLILNVGGVYNGHTASVTC